MSLIDQVKKTVEEQDEAKKGNSEYRELSAFYAKMKELGLVQKQEYSIPPLDTTGRRVRELMCQTNC